MDTLKGAINILTDKTDPANPVYKTLYPKTTASQVEGFTDAVKDLVGDTISVSGTNGSRKTVIGNLQTDAITTSTGGAISATVTNATTATTATNDVNNKALTSYIGSVASVSGAANQINVKTGAQVSSNAAGTTITINNVEKAQKDSNGKVLTSYIGSVAAGSTSNQIVVKTGAQVNDGAAGTTITINNVANATSATSATKDGSNNTITSTYIKGISVSGSTLTYTKGDNTTGTATLPAAGATSDVNVTQNLVDYTEEDDEPIMDEDIAYPIIFKKTANTTAETGNVNFTSDIAINPYSKTITAGQFIGDLTGTATNVSGTVSVSHGGTGLTTSPSMLTNLGSTTAANVLQASPRPGITGTLPIAHGGTGNTTGKAVSADTLATTRTIDGVNFNGSANITHFAVCTTAAKTAAKVVTLTGFTLTNGASLKVLFNFDNSASNATLNVSNTGAKAIHFAGTAIDASVITAGSVLELVYYNNVYNITGRTAAGSGGNITITAPEQPAVVTYSGSAYTPFADFLDTWDTRFITASGTYTATNAGVYTAVFQPTLSYTWADTLARLPKTYTWTIKQVTGTLTVGATAENVVYSESKSIGCTINYGSTVLINSSANTFSNTYMTVAYNHANKCLVVTAKSGSQGSTALTIAVPSNSNYTQPASKTLTINVCPPGYGIRYVTSGGHVRGTNWKNVDYNGTVMTIADSNRYYLDAWA